MFFHLDETNRSRGMQRWDAKHYEVIVCIRSEDIAKHVGLNNIYVDQGNVSIKVPVPRYSFDRIVQPPRDKNDVPGLVVYDCLWVDAPVEGTISDGGSNDISVVQNDNETSAEFNERATYEGCDGAIFGCPSCKAVNPCGMLVCLNCHRPFLFRLKEYPSYIISPMGREVVEQTARRASPNLVVPEPVRRPTDEVARAMRYGSHTGGMPLFN